MQQPVHYLKTLFLALTLLFSFKAYSQLEQIHYFNFNENTPPSNTNWAQPIAATIGSGQLTYTFTEAYSFTGTTVNGNPGEVNGGSFVPRGGFETVNNGDHFVLSIPTTGYEGIMLTYATQRTTTGFDLQTVEYTVNGTDWIEIATIDDIPSSFGARSVDLSSISGANDNADFAVRFILTGATSAAGNNRFDNISVSGAPAGMALSPNFIPDGGTFFAPVDVVIETATPDADIFYSTVSDDGPWTAYSDAVTVDETTTIWAYAVADGLADSNVASATFTFPEVTEVATLADLRNMPVDGTIYMYTGEAVIVAMDGFRNRKFIQDATAAILIDDDPGVITTQYNLYDVITDVPGKLNVFNNLVRFQPQGNTPQATMNTPVNPVVFALDEVTADDQAKLIQFKNVSFENVDEGAVFANGTNYSLTDGVHSFVLRTDFWNVDYIGEPIPDNSLDITGVLLQYQDDLQIVPRFEDDILPAVPPHDSGSILVSTEAIPSFRNVYIDDYSDVQFYSVEASDLEGDLIITAGSPLKISLNCTYDFQTSIVLESSDGNVPEHKVYVRAFPEATGNYNASIAHTDGTVSELVSTHVTAIASQIPSGYYSTATGTGAALMTQLHNIINDHTVLSYASIWEHFTTTDAKFNGKVWDVFSYVECDDSPYEYTFFDDQQGADPVPDEEGVVYNREHLWPQSWWSGSDPSPMVTDIHHVYPADRWVNMQKSNYPFGEINDPVWTSEAGNMIGNNSFGADYSGMVFEPVDELKGDFARTYFYMATRYMDQLPVWSNNSMASNVLDGTEFPGFEAWFLDLLLEWHINDPVSQKEIERNNAIFGLQNNRNPFIDNPAFVELVWGDVPDIPDGDLCNLDFEDWTDGLPDCWYGEKSNISAANVIQYADNPQSGSYATQLINTGTSHQRFTSKATTVEEGVMYVITFWVKGQGEVRTGLFDDREANFGYAPYNEYIQVNSGAWSEHSQIVTAANTSDIAEFIFSLRNTNDALSHLQLDNVNVLEHEPDPPLEVDNLADLRSMPADGSVYHYTGHAVIVAMDDFRNRKFIQDETAAILIDDLPGIIETEYELYDRITDIIGKISIVNNMVRFQPEENTAPATENTPVDPLMFEFDEVTPSDQAKLIQFESVVFVDFDESDVFENGSNYTISDGVNEFALRTDFWNVDYIGQEIPGTPVNLSGVVLQFQEILQIVPRFLDDFELLDELFFTVTFVVQDTAGQDVENAVVTLGDIENAAGDYVFENVVTGEYSFSVSALCFETFNGDLNVLEEMEVEVVLEALPGDANGDGVVNVLDVISIVEYYLDAEPDPFCFSNADVNGDDVIDVLDVIATVNLFISGKTAPYPGLLSDAAHLYLNPEGIYLESDGTLAGLQFELTGSLLQALDLKLLLPDHQMVYAVDNDVMRVMIFSLDNTPIPAGKTGLVMLNASAGLLQFGEALAGNLNAEKVELVTHNYDATSAGLNPEDAGLRFYPNPASGELFVTFTHGGDTPAVLSLVNLHGQAVLSETLTGRGRHETVLSLEGLTPGVYMLRLELGNHLFIEKVVIK